MRSLKRKDYIKIIYDYLNDFNVCNLICEYGCLGYTIKEAKEIRKKDIEMRKEYRGAFADYFYGNDGSQYIWCKNKEIIPFVESRTEKSIWDCEYWTTPTVSNLDTNPSLYESDSC